jgi:hypothetical protein
MATACASGIAASTVTTLPLRRIETLSPARLASFRSLRLMRESMNLLLFC